MNNRVIFAAAGNGKTYGICRSAREYIKNTDDKKFVLLLTYTNEGAKSLEIEYKKQNYGVTDPQIEIRTWYSFILSEFIKPYQRKLKLKYKDHKEELEVTLPENYIKSIAFYETKEKPRWYKSLHIQYYLNSAGDIRKDDTSGLAYVCIQHSDGRVLERLESIYSCIFIDELQDYAGWDLELFKILFKSSIKITCVGDYKQATFRTNSSTKNRQYRDDKIKDFFTDLSKKNICTLEFNNETRRFGDDICSYANTIFKDDVASQLVPNYEVLDRREENTGIYLIDNKYLFKYCSYYKPVILRYNVDSKINFNHNCRVYNYGASKGATFNRTVVVPVRTVLPFVLEEKEITSAQTKAKFYVACTRARYSVVFAVDNPKETNQFKQTVMNVGENQIPVFKYTFIHR